MKAHRVPRRASSLVSKLVGLLLGLLFVPLTVIAATGVAQAGDHLCGWNGDVVPLLAKADRQVRKVNIPHRAEQYFGPGAKVASYELMEADLYAVDPAATSPLSAATLTDNRVTYNVVLDLANGDQVTSSVQLRYSGMCWRTTLFVDGPWAGSAGLDKTLTVSADEALVLANRYRAAHPSHFPLDQPLVMMNLMEPTTPVDFGKLLWYVNYANPAGGMSILAVYMDGTVAPIRR